MFAARGAPSPLPLAISLSLLICSTMRVVVVSGTTVLIERDALSSTIELLLSTNGTATSAAVPPNKTTTGSFICEYAGEIVLSHPMSVNRKDYYYYFGSQLLAAAHMTVDEINQWPNCGVSLVDAESNDSNDDSNDLVKKNYSLRLKTYGDESSTEKTAQIGRYIANDNKTDFMLAGFSSTLTGHLTPIAQEYNKVCLTAGSSKTSVYAEMDHAFGMLAPSGLYLGNAIKGTAAAGAKTVAFVAEQDINFICKGAAKMAELNNMTLLEGVNIPNVNAGTPEQQEIFRDVARNMSELNPDVMVTCFRNGVQDWNMAMRHQDWTPKAIVYMVVFGTKEFEKELGTDVAYTMGVTSWDPRVLPPIPDAATHWTPADFDRAYQEAMFRPTVYQIAAQSAAVSVLAQAINRVGVKSSNLTEEVKNKMSSEYFPTVYGNVSFDANGQSTVPYMLLQYDANHKLHVLQPTDLVSTDFDVVYPMPTWANRDCNILSACTATNGTCTVNGTCHCPAPLLSVGGSGATAECLAPPSEDEAADDRVQTLVAITTPVVLVIAMLVGAALFAYYHKKQQENNAVWLVKKEELIFAEPPEVIGHGTFGLVLLAEFRGTQVAVKRVLPPSSDKSATTTRSTTGKEEQQTAEQVTASLGSASNDQRPGSGRVHHNGLSYTNGMTTWGGFGSGLVSTIAGTPSSILGKKSRKGWGSGSRSHRKSSSKTDGKKHHRKLRDDFIAEMRCVSKLRHPCITTIMGAVLTKMDEPMLIMEYMDRGSLYGILHNETMLLEGEVILSLLRDVSQGCRFLHAAQPQVIHGDLRAGNILVDAKFRAKVADFGLSQTSSGDRARGTPFWMAPELLRGESTNTAESDVYAFGIILYEVFSRKDPYHEDEEKSVKDVLRQVMDPAVNKRPPIPRNCPPQMAALMSDCIVGDPDERPSFSEIDMRLQRAQHGAAAETAGLLAEAPMGKRHPSSHGDNGNKLTVSLFDIFPKHIAEALVDGKQVEPEHRDSVTIFFCDIVGYTNISSELEPRKVADMLDRLYQEFDRLSQEHDIFKVETIGDAYMAVTNLVKDQTNDHAKRIAKFAVKCIWAANNTLIDKECPDKGHINIRVGIHSGPVVADVVGTRNPRYCLFGDSVNVASRMESNSSPNRIHCSENSAALLLKQFPEMPLKCRGTIDVKGKGEMKTYWVNEGSYLVNEGTGGGTVKAMPMIQEEQDAAASLKNFLNTSIPVIEQSDRSAESTTENSDEDTNDHVVLDLEAQDDNGAPPEQHPGVVGLEARSKMRGIEATIRERFGHGRDDTCSTSSSNTVNC